jgi:hypothetical protein
MYRSFIVRLSSWSEISNEERDDDDAAADRIMEEVKGESGWEDNSMDDKEAGDEKDNEGGAELVSNIGITGRSI